MFKFTSINVTCITFTGPRLSMAKWLILNTLTIITAHYRRNENVGVRIENRVRRL